MAEDRPDSAAAALTFINVCFAVAVAALMVVMTHDGMSPEAKASWVALGSSIIFLLWKQYTNCEMPFQHALGMAGSADTADALSYAIAVLMTAVMVALTHCAALALKLTLIVIGLTGVKALYMLHQLSSGQRKSATDKARGYLWMRIIGLIVSALMATGTLVFSARCLHLDVWHGEKDWRIPILLILCYSIYWGAVYIPWLRKPSIDEYRNDLYGLKSRVQ